MTEPAGQSLALTPANAAKRAAAHEALERALLAAQRRGFHGQVGVTVEIKDGTAMQVAHKVEQRQQ